MIMLPKPGKDHISPLNYRPMGRLNNIAFRHPVALIYSSQTILFSSTMQLIYFFLLLFTFTTCFGRTRPSSGVILPKTLSLCGVLTSITYEWDMS
jgi:hypothetical protein